MDLKAKMNSMIQLLMKHTLDAGSDAEDDDDDDIMLVGDRYLIPVLLHSINLSFCIAEMREKIES